MQTSSPNLYAAYPPLDQGRIGVILGALGQATVSIFHKESVSDGLDAQNLAGSAFSAKNQFSEQIFGLV